MTVSVAAVQATPVLHGDIYGGDEDWMSRGHSAIVAPSGDLLAGPLLDEEGILYATVDIVAARAQRRMFDPVGHYARPDVFTLTVNTTAQQPVRFAATPATT